MKSILAALFFVTASSVAATPELDKTPTGIPLDSAWRKKAYSFAAENLIHPSWGLAHSERAYQMTKSLAEKERIAIDLDVVFAAAFLHDLGGLTKFAKKDLDHAVRSVELAYPLLIEWGFPAEKFPAVKEMILGHTYYSSPPKSQSALAFRDADVLDFLGAIGVARILGATLDPDFADGSLKPTVSLLKNIEKTMAAKCSLQLCKDLAQLRLSEMSGFLKSLDQETFGGQAQ